MTHDTSVTTVWLPRGTGNVSRRLKSKDQYNYQEVTNSNNLLFQSIIHNKHQNYETWASIINYQICKFPWSCSLTFPWHARTQTRMISAVSTRVARPWVDDTVLATLADIRRMFSQTASEEFLSTEIDNNCYLLNTLHQFIYIKPMFIFLQVWWCLLLYTVEPHWLDLVSQACWLVAQRQMTTYRSILKSVVTGSNNSEGIKGSLQ